MRVVHLRFQNTPEAFHRRVIQTTAYSGHALPYTSVFHLLTKGTTGILNAPITVEQRFGLRESLQGQVKGFKDQSIIIAVTEGESDDIPSIQI